MPICQPNYIVAMNGLRRLWLVLAFLMLLWLLFRASGWHRALTCHRCKTALRSTEGRAC